MYNLTNLSNVTTHVELIQNTNSLLLYGWLGVLLLLIIGAISFISFFAGTRDVTKSLIGTLFLSFGFSMLFRAMGILSDIGLFISFVGLAFAIGLGFVNWR